MYDVQSVDNKRLVLTGLIPHTYGATRYLIGWNSSSNNAPVAIREQYVDGTLYRITPPKGDGRSRYENPDQVCGFQSRTLQFDAADNRVEGVILGEEPAPVGVIVQFG